MKTTRSISGTFVIWEPDSKLKTGHRLLDSDRPYTSYFKYGRLTTEGETVFLEKSRNFVRVLAFVASTPVWGTLIIGLCFLLDFLPGHLSSKHPELIILFITGSVISVFVLIIRKFIKPIRRQFPRSQIANVRIKQVQISRYAPTRMGLVGVDFSVTPPVSFIETAKGGGSIRIASPEKCSFVTFVALRESEVKVLREWLPTTQVALAGNLDANIPPQQAAPRTSAAGGDQSSSHAGINTEKRYSHNVARWFPEVMAVGSGLFAFFFGRTAATNNRGLLINGTIHLGPTGATIFYCLMAAFFGVGFILLAGVALQCIFNPHSLLLGLEGVTFFKGWLKPKKTFIPFKAIEALLQQQGVKGGSRALILVVKGQRFAIQEANLSHPGIYPEICAAIASGQKNARKVSEKPAQTPSDDSRYMPKK